jgi:hypothetical protein
MLDPTPAPWPSAALVLEGRFFAIRPVDPAGDAEPLFVASHQSPADAAMWDYMSAGPFASAEALRAWMVSLVENGAYVSFTAIERDSGRPIGGCVYLNIVPSNRSIEPCVAPPVGAMGRHGGLQSMLCRASLIAGGADAQHHDPQPRWKPQGAPAGAGRSAWPLDGGGGP